VIFSSPFHMVVNWPVFTIYCHYVQLHNSGKINLVDSTNILYFTSGRSMVCAPLSQMTASNRAMVSLYFACVVDDANVYWTRATVCLSVRRRIPTLLHGPGCNLGER